VADGSKVHSMVAEHILVYEHSGQIMFENGGMDARLDDIWPTISILTPYNNARVVGIETITVLALDINGISRVEYYIDGYYQTTVSDSPYSWEWNTYYTSDNSYTVTAMVYDRAGHYSSDTRTYYVDNGVDFVPPTGEIVSPLNGTSTDYNPVLIEAIVRDNFAINFSSIKIELYNGSDWEDITTHSNTTITNTSLTEYTIRYLHSTQFANDTYGVYVYAEEQFYEYPDENKNKNVTLEWNFTIIPINDINNPTVEITFPLNPIHLVVGDYIEVGYDITDTSVNDSGIDYFIINVTYNSTEVYTHPENVSSYQNVVYETSGFYEFPKSYVDQGSYEYNITVYDRAGNSADDEIVSLTSSFGQEYYLVVDNIDTNSDAKIVKFKISSNGPTIYIDGLNISKPVGKEIDKLFFGSNFNPNRIIPYEWTFTTDRTITTADTDVTLTFLENLPVSEEIYLTFIFSDGTSKYISIISNPP